MSFWIAWGGACEKQAVLRTAHSSSVAPAFHGGAVRGVQGIPRRIGHCGLPAAQSSSPIRQASRGSFIRQPSEFLPHRSAGRTTTSADVVRGCSGERDWIGQPQEAPVPAVLPAAAPELATSARFTLLTSLCHQVYMFSLVTTSIHLMPIFHTISFHPFY